MTQHAQKIEAQRYEENLSAPNYSSAFWLKVLCFLKFFRTFYGKFHLVEGETEIFSAISEKEDDFDNLINAARKAVEHGYRVYILPNPRSCRTADFI